MIKRLFLLLLFASTAFGADISTTQLFTDGDTVNGAKLNNIIGNSSVLPGMITDRAIATPVAATDYVVFYNAASSSLKKTTFATAFSSGLTNSTLTGNTNISELFSLGGDISPAQIVANTNDYAPTGLSTASTLRLNTDASRNITGLTGGADGRILLIHNVGSFNIVLTNADAASSAANRFALTHDITLTPNSVVFLQYDSTTSRWRTTGSHTHSIADITDPVSSLSPAFSTLTDGATVTLTCNNAHAVQNRTWTLGGTGRILQISGATSGMTGTIKVIQDATGSRKIVLPGPQFTDGATTNTSTTVSSTAAAFVASDVNKPIVGAGIPVGATIASVAAPNAVISSAATATASGVTFTLPGRYSKVSGNGNGAVILTTAANSVDWLTWVCDGTNSYAWTIGTNFN